jgi:hypothetical protein
MKGPMLKLLKQDIVVKSFKSLDGAGDITYNTPTVTIKGYAFGSQVTIINEKGLEVTSKVCTIINGTDASKVKNKDYITTPIGAGTVIEVRPYFDPKLGSTDLVEVYI